MRLTENQLRRIIRSVINESRFGRFRSLEHFLLTVVWKQYMNKKPPEDCLKVLDEEQKQIMKDNVNHIYGLINDEQFEEYATIVAEMCQ